MIAQSKWTRLTRLWGCAVGLLMALTVGLGVGCAAHGAGDSGIATAAGGTAEAAAVSVDTLTVHYVRYGGDYESWTLWTWDAKTGQGPKELKSAGKDDAGLIFHVLKSDYGDGTQIGLLPKY
ncbi:MAG: pullulanase-associated domain-containing protein, partial [bacterium]